MENSRQSSPGIGKLPERPGHGDAGAGNQKATGLCEPTRHSRDRRGDEHQASGGGRAHRGQPQHASAEAQGFLQGSTVTILPGGPPSLQDHCRGWSCPNTQGLCRDDTQWVHWWPGCPGDPPGPGHQQRLPAGPAELRPGHGAHSRPGEGPQWRRGPGRVPGGIHGQGARPRESQPGAGGRAADAPGEQGHTLRELGCPPGLMGQQLPAGEYQDKMLTAASCTVSWVGWGGGSISESKSAEAGGREVSGLRPERLTLHVHAENINNWSSHHGTAETTPTRNHEVSGSIPGLAEWVRIQRCCELWCGLQMRLGSGIAVALV